MKRLLKPLTLVAALLLGATAPAAENGVLVVMSSNLKPYQEALAGIRGELGEDTETVILSDGEPEISPRVRVVIAVGGRAATRSYPAGVRLIYCLAPGLKLSGDEKKDGPVRVRTSPMIQKMVFRFKRIQPSLRKLGVLWISESVEISADDRKRVQDELGVEIVDVKLESAAGMPGALRKLRGEVNAIWLPPDPQLVSETSLAMLRSFSWANKVPFFAPTAALVEKGAVAAISSSFEEMGRVSATAARDLLSGTAVPAAVHPEKIQMTINPAAAVEAGLAIPADVMAEADGTVR